MKYKYRARLAGIITILLLFSFSGCSAETEKTRTRAIDAPDFTLKALTGEDITLSNYRGKVVLLDFWATWCGPCVYSIPELVRIQEKYRNKGLIVLGVSMDTLAQADERQLNKFIAKFNIQYQVMRDDGSVSSKYFGNSPAPIPTMHIINKEGKIIKTIVGFQPGEAEKLIESFF